MSKELRCLFQGVLITEQKMGVCLPATTKAKFTMWVLMEKEKGFIWMLQYLGEWGTPHSDEAQPSSASPKQKVVPRVPAL